MDRAPTLAVLIYLLLHGVGSSGSATTSGRGLLLDGTPRWMKGVTWNPVAAGGTHPADVDFSGFVAQDAALMRAAGVNVVRNYEPLRNPKVLDVLAEHGISLIASVYPWGGAAVTAVDDIVAATKDHPAVLMWYIGNEWNYNGLYVGLDLNASTARVAEVARRVKALDPSRPVATVYGEIPDVATFAALAEPIDLWGLNVYHGGSFGSLFDDWLVRSAGTPRPMFIAEYGADAWDSRGEGKYNPQAQAHATTALAAEIAARPDACVGGIIFELADEWWKDQAGAPDVHDVGGIAPGSGPPPDDVFNEEWWGLVDVNRTPRLAYYAYAATPNATASPSPRHSPPATGGSAASVRSPVRWRWSATAFGLLLLLLTHC